MNTGQIFGRNYTLTVIPDDDGEPLVYEPPMQVRFAVINSADNAISTALITIYGLSVESRNRLRKQDATVDDFSSFGTVVLKAGYGDETPEIFRGEINSLEIGHEGPNLYTRLYCATKQLEWTKVVINKSWGNNTPALEVLTDIAETFGIRVEMNGDFSDIQPFVKGYRAAGLSSEYLDRMAYEWGFTKRITDTAVIITRNNAVRNNAAYEISANSGMEGTPRFYYRETEIDIRMYGIIQPDDVVHITSDFWTINYSNIYTQVDRAPSEMTRIGKFKVLATSHEGDFWGDAWRTTLRCYWYGAKA